MKKIPVPRATLLRFALVAALLPFVWTGCSGDEGETPDYSDFTFVMMSDPHVDRGPFRPGNYNLPRAVERINSLEPGPDFVVLAGDLINTAPSEVPEYYCEHTTEIDLLSHLLRDLVPPIHFVLGNHDYYKVILNRLVSDHKAMEEVWQKELGVGAPAAFDHQGFRFILLNSMQNYEDRLSEQDWWTGAFGAEQLDWLERALEKGRPSILFFHHDEGSFPDDSPFFDIVYGFRDTIKGIFTGHIHEFTRGTIYGIPYYTPDAIKWGWGQLFVVECQQDSQSIRVLNEGDFRFTELGEVGP